MKKYLPKLACLLSLFFLFSCGDTEDTPTTIDPVTDPLLRIESLVKQLENLEIGIPKDWELTKNAVERAAFARYLFSIGRIPISQDLYDIYTQDPIVQAEYYRAQLIRRFGDIPQVHTVADYDLENAMAILLTDAELNTVIKAHSFLFPDQPIPDVYNEQIPLHPHDFVSEDLIALAKIRKENPEAWADHNLARLIKAHGDTPDVRIIADFMRKVELGLPRTDDECRTYLDKIHERIPKRVTLDEHYGALEADSQLANWLSAVDQCRLEAYRWARGEGISFAQVDWIELNEKHTFCQKEE